MSELSSAHAEKRIQSFVVKPLSLVFIAATAVSIYHSVWWATAVFVLLWFYTGWIGGKLSIHRGKPFHELSQGNTANLPLSHDEDLTRDEVYALVRTMLHASYAVIIAVVAALIVLGLKIYWSLLIGLVLLVLGNFGAGVAVMFVAAPRTMVRRLRGK